MRVKRGYKGMEVGGLQTCVLKASGELSQPSVTYRTRDIERAWRGRITPFERMVHREAGVTRPRYRVLQRSDDVGRVDFRYRTRTPRAGFGDLVMFPETSSKGRMVNR